MSGSGERADAIPDAACEAYLQAATGPTGDATVFERVRRGLAAAAPLLPGGGRLHGKTIEEWADTAAQLADGDPAFLTRWKVAERERDEARAEVERLRSLLSGGGEAELCDWLMRTVGSASTLASAKRVVEDLVAAALVHPDAERAPQEPCPTCGRTVGNLQARHLVPDGDGTTWCTPVRPEQPSPDSLGGQPPSEPEER